MRLAYGISRSGRVSRTISCQAPARSRINSADWNFRRKIRRALRGAPPCTPANRCSETQSQRIRPCLFVERTKLRNFCPILRTVWILDLRAHEDKVSHTPSSQNAHGHATAEACKRAGVPLIKGQPCPCCRKTVHDKNGHAAQCAVLFQILFYHLLHGLKRTNKHLRGPATPTTSPS